MPQRKRQMQLAVFWLGPGNHVAGWRMEGAFDSTCDWSMTEAGAKIAPTTQARRCATTSSNTPDDMSASLTHSTDRGA